MKYPLARPMRNRPTYKASIFVVAIMMMFATQHPKAAIHRHDLRPSFAATKPAVPDEIKAPSIIRDEISCCRVVLMFHIFLAGI